MQRLWSPTAHRLAAWSGSFSAGNQRGSFSAGNQRGSFSAGNQRGSFSAGNLACGTATAHRRPYSVTLASNPEPHETDALDGGEAADDEDPRIRRMRVEAVLLISKAPLSPRKLAQLAHLADATEARTLVRQLNRVYDTQGRAIRVEQVAGGFRMLTHPMLAPWLARLGHLPPVVRLSTPMMETLAVVAYRQPVSRASAEAIRGVACGELLRQLMERDLIRIAGRSEELGRPYLYGTTKRFLQLFGLSNTDALPPIHWHPLQDDDSPDLPLDDLSTSTKEPVVSTSIAPAFGPAVFDTTVADNADLIPILLVETDADAIGSDSPSIVNQVSPSAAIDDDEDDSFDDDDEEDDDWDDDDDDDDDWDDDDEDEDDDDEEEDDDDELDDDWEEVDDDDEEDDDEVEDDDEGEDDVEADDDEDWSEDSDDEVEDDDVEDEDEDDDKWD